MMQRKKKGSKKAILQDVACTARVSLATVSRVLNGTARCSPEIQKRVQTAAAKLGVTLRPRRNSSVVAFLLANRPMLHPFHSRILTGAELCSNQRDCGMVFVSFRYSIDSGLGQLQCPRILQHREIVDGVIVAGMNSQNVLDLLAERGFPFAVLGNNVVGEWASDRYDVVWFDDIEGAAEITTYVQSMGHRDIWFIGNTRLPWYARRYEGYRKAMVEAGLVPRLETRDLDQDREVGFLATKSIFARREPCSAIFAGGDPVAQGVYEALRELNLKIPEDIGVAGFNDIEAPAMQPPLTSVRVFPEEIGKELVQLILNRIERPDLPPRHSVIPSRLIKRESCTQLLALSRTEPKEIWVRDRARI